MLSRRFLVLSPVNIALAYLGFGILWIATTDVLVAVFVAPPDVAAFLQTIKGWVFVALSSLLVFGLTRARERELERSEERLRTATEQIQVLTRVLRHNVRNDVNVIDGYIDLVQDGLQREELRRQLAHARERSRRIANVSDKMRVLSDVDVAGGIEGSVDLVEITDDCLADVRAKRDDATGIEAEFPESATIRATPSVRHAIAELLENALEHGCDDPGEACVSLDIQRRNAEVLLRIADDGPGIPRHELEPFEEESESDLRHMSGVGLWIAKWLCEIHGGAIGVETGSDGTVVTLRFPGAAERSGVERAVRETKRTLDDVGSPAG